MSKIDYIEEFSEYAENTNQTYLVPEALEVFYSLAERSHSTEEITISEAFNKAHKLKMSREGG